MSEQGVEHGGNEETHEADDDTHQFTHAETEQHTPVRKGGEQARRERDASKKEGHVAQRPRRERRKGEEPQASHRNRPVGGAEEGRQGSAQAIVRN